MDARFIYFVLYFFFMTKSRHIICEYVNILPILTIIKLEPDNLT